MSEASTPDDRAPAHEPSLAGRSSARIAPLTRRLQIGVLLGIGAIALALVVLWVLLDRRHRAVEATLSGIVAVGNEMSSATDAMDAAIAGAQLAASDYVATGERAQRIAFAGHSADFTAAKTQFDALTASPRQRELGSRAVSLYQRFIALGLRAMDLRDRRAELRRRIEADFLKLDQGRGGLRAGDATDAALRASVRELGRSLGQLLLGADAAFQSAALAALSDARTHIDGLAQSAPTRALRERAAELASTAELIGVDVRELVELDARARRGDAELAVLRDRLDDVLRSIRIESRHDLARASRGVTLGMRPRDNLLLVGALIGVTGLAGVLIVGRSLRLREAADELARETQRREVAERERSHLLERLVGAQEEERARVSRELHDQMGQKLSYLIFGLDKLERRDRGEASAASAEISALRAIAGELLDDAHAVAQQLRPPALTDLGLQGALLDLVERWRSQTGIPVDFYDDGDGLALSAQVETTLYRVAQEALTNVRKHASASAVSVVLRRLDGAVRLVVEDDGVGFDPATAERAAPDGAGLGLRGMRERVALVGGTLAIESEAGKGTTLAVTIPLPASH